MARASNVFPCLEVRQAAPLAEFRPQASELLPVFQELDNFLQSLLGLIRSGTSLNVASSGCDGEQTASQRLAKLNALLPPDCQSAA